MALTGQSTDDQAVLDAEHELWTTTFSYIKSMALKSALDLRLADAIHHHGGAATLPQILSRVAVHPSKIPCLRRLMRTLTVSGVFSVVQQQDVVVPAAPVNNDTGTYTGAEPSYTLTPVSRLLVGSQKSGSIMAFVLSPVLVAPFLGIGAWFQHSLPDPCLFEQAHGEALWEMSGHDAALDALINSAMVSDSRFIVDIAVRESGDVFRGISSLVDVGGGLGAAAQVISEAFPHVECSVLELEHVVSKAPAGTSVKYVAGDMFESVPPADAVFLKSVLHDWDDEKCVKILKTCRKAVPPREAGGKVIIIDIVVGADKKHGEVHALLDLYIMFINGVERDEQEWSKIFLEAGFSDYKIIPVLGFRSIIEVYP
ncbi:O-methyltransferase ZRP4 [Aegilops tauschii subsp. strangulata]|uniref:acetylserotonin O-methyltransferase n=3 Tax=Triticinae TaxID=1648030 RepID=A0A452ZJT1_AEGTS|nr:O-methyltransferase ZRP4 [Aegilops tauschii subsp. strangulata]XP_044445719.1 O-methyltransferase ZRP4-like [Triticum aestivum]